MSDLETELVAIVRADPGLMQVLTTVRSLDLPDWRLVSGAVYQAVWNAQTGRPVGYGIKDYDIGYFDPDVSWDAEDVIIRRVAAAFEPPFRDLVEVRNQARVHLWFENKFGEAYEALTCTDDAPAQFVAPAFALAVRLEKGDTVSGREFACMGGADTPHPTTSDAHRLPQGEKGFKGRDPCGSRPSTRPRTGRDEARFPVSRQWRRPS